MYTLKSIAQRGATLSAAFVLVVSSLAASAAPAFADSLNPLTKRSLTLSSSSPGWADTDGSGNSTYAPPNSGTNGFKAGNTFEFNVSTDSSASGTNLPIQAMTFQYCTTSAGDCTSPGNNASHGPTPTATTADLNAAYPSPTEVISGASGFDKVVDSGDGSIKGVPGATNPLNPSDVTGQYVAHGVAGNYVVYYNNGGTWTPSSGWNMATSNAENGSGTGQNNYITLWNSTGLGIPSDTTVKVVFFGTTDNYITNPGDGAFFVKINTYKAFTGGTAYSSTGPVTAVAPTVSAGDVIDGGVTVANVMNQSIQITTKVLETMQFSVGTVDPNTLASGGTAGSSDLFAANGNNTHGPCDPVVKGLTASDPQNVLQLGNQAAESSLSTDATYSTHSYWRLSSNSSAGATVYYSGSTLSNTENDQISAIGTTASAPLRGAPQFGLAISDGTRAANNGTSADGTAGQNYAVNYNTEDGLGGNAGKGDFENAADQGKSTTDGTFATDMSSGSYSYHPSQLWPLIPDSNYDSGAGIVNGAAGALGTGYGTPNTKFAFDPESQTIPTPIASENAQVVDCVTAKMRYIGNIAATTPAGIYTTKINYIAAPQY